MALRLCIFIAALTAFLAAASATGNWGRVRAAEQVGGALFLFLEDGSYVETSSGRVRQQSDFGISNSYAMTAATCFLFYMGRACIFYGNEQIYYGSQLLNYANRDEFYYSSQFPDFVWHGIDAAIKTSRDQYFLKGCEYVTRSATGHWDLTLRNVALLGVPCNVDAGWHDGTNAVVLKDDQVWFLGGDVTQSLSFDSYLAR